jgi:Tfp pilus assembly protein PilV
MIETIIAVLFLLAIVLVALGPKRSDKKAKDLDTSSPPAPKAPDSPKK